MRSTLEQFTEFFVHEFMEELWYLQKVARGDIAARPDVDPWEKIFNVAQALLSLSPIAGLPTALIVFKETLGTGVDFLQKTYQAGKQVLEKVDAIEEKYHSLTDKTKSAGLMETLKQDMIDLEAMRSLAEWLGRGLSQRYEQVLTDILDTDQPEKSTILLAREGARRCFQYLQSKPFFDEKSSTDSMLSQRLRLLNSVNLGKIEKSWREQIVNITSHRLPRWVHNFGKEKLAVKPERMKGISKVKKIATAKADFTAEAFYMRCAWYSDESGDCCVSTTKHEKTKWWKEEKSDIQYPKYGYAYLEDTKQLPLEKLKIIKPIKITSFAKITNPDDIIFRVPSRQQRIYQPVTALEIKAYLESEELKIAKETKRTATLTFHEFLHQEKYGYKYPKNCQAVCHEDLTTLSVTLAYGNFTLVDFSGATITGDVTGCCFDQGYLVSTIFKDIQCDNPDISPLSFANANLAHAQLVNAPLVKANLNQTNLSFANLDHANVTAAKILGTRWYKTRLNGVEQKDLLSIQEKQIETMQRELKKWQTRMDERALLIEKELEPMVEALSRLEITIKTVENSEKLTLEEQKEKLSSLITHHASIEWVKQYLQEELEKLRTMPEQAQAMVEIQEKVGALMREKADTYSQFDALSKTIAQLSKEIADLQEISKNHALRLSNLDRQKSNLRIQVEDKIEQMHIALKEVQAKIPRSDTLNLQQIHQEIQDKWLTLKQNPNCKWEDSTEREAVLLDWKIQAAIQEQKKRLDTMSYCQHELKELRRFLLLAIQPDTVRALQIRKQELQHRLISLEKNKISQSIDLLLLFTNPHQRDQFIEPILKPLNDRFNSELKALYATHAEELQRLNEKIKSFDRELEARLGETEAVMRFLNVRRAWEEEIKEVKISHLQIKSETRQNLEVLQNELLVELKQLMERQLAQQVQQQQYQQKIIDLQTEAARQVDASRVESLRNKLQSLKEQDLVFMTVRDEHTIDLQRVEEFLKGKKEFQGKPVLIEKSNQFSIYALSEKGESRLMHGLDTSQFNELKYVNGSVSSDSKARNKIPGHVPVSTKADGDCAFHAILGIWNPSKNQLVCDMKGKRAGVHTAIINQDNKEPLRGLIVDGIKELVMSGRDIGKNSQQLREKYQQFESDQKSADSLFWNQFAKVLQGYPVILDYIQNKHKLPKESLFRHQFYNALNQNDGELYGRIRSLHDLYEAFQTYNQLQNSDLDWNTVISAGLKQEYANFVGTSSVWLLPSELAIIANVFHVSVIYYPSPNASPLTLNPGEKLTVAVQFNGRDHYERLKLNYDETAIILSGNQVPEKVYKEITSKSHNLLRNQLEVITCPVNTQPVSDRLNALQAAYEKQTQELKDSGNEDEAIIIKLQQQSEHFAQWLHTLDEQKAQQTEIQKTAITRLKQELDVAQANIERLSPSTQVSNGKLDDSPELIRLRQQAQQAEIKDRQALLNKFLDTIKEMVKDKAERYLPKTPSERLKIMKPQVFLSYAWEADKTSKLTHLQNFLEQLEADLRSAGLTPWFDLPKMTGHLDEQMRSNIEASQYVLLIGTNRYGERTKPDRNTNVRKELDFALAEAKRDPNFLLPLMLEGDFGTTFPSAVSEYLIRDCRSWYSLEKGQWESLDNYIKELTQYKPLGILPCLLGLNRPGEYWEACLKTYQSHQQSLMRELEFLQIHKSSSNSRPIESRLVIEVTPVLQIPLKELDYNKETDKIGSGSYGEVYYGQWQGRQTVAVKELTGTIIEEVESNLYQEAKIMAYLTKKQKEDGQKWIALVQLFGLVVEKPRYALVMEYVPNRTLFDLLHRKSDLPDLPWDLRYQLASDIAEGLALLHSQGILHRDLRSHNVLLTIFEGRLRAKLSDFGLSTIKHSLRTQTAKKTHSAAGTLAWMAPELHDPDDGKSSKATDIYSYGVTLWELVTREIPFKNANSPYVIPGWVLVGKTNKIPEDCPPKLTEMIKKCWEFKPENRIEIEIIQQKLSTEVKAHPFSSETQAVIEVLKKSQIEQEEKWNMGLKKKPPIIIQPFALEEMQRQLEIKNQEEITRIQQQHQVEQLGLQKQLEMQELAAAEEKLKLEAQKKQEIQRLEHAYKIKLELHQKKTEPVPPLPSPSKPSLTLVDQKSLNQLLQWVVEGEQDKAEELIQKDQNLLLHAGTVKDLSGRKFKGITAFQYALWAMDYHMWRMIQKYLPKESQAEQLQALESKSTRHGKHFSLKELTDALQVYVDNAEKVWKYDQAEIYWCKVVGGAQKRLPVHVVNEYCRADRAFEPCPLEWESKLPRTLTLKVWNSRQLKMVDGSWFISPSSQDGLGWNYAFLRYNSTALCCMPWVYGTRRVPTPDLKALQSLWKTRTQQLKLLKSQLLSVGFKRVAYGALTTPLPLPSVSSGPKPMASSAQLALQDRLIEACKQGNEKAIKALFLEGAQPNKANAKGEQPLGAGVWGMCPGVVNALLEHMEGIAPMTWEECEKHNQEHYKEVFIISKFAPQTYRKWYDLLLKMDCNSFICDFHLMKADKKWRDNGTTSWESLKAGVREQLLGIFESIQIEECLSATEKGYVRYRIQIKQGIEHAKHPNRMKLKFDPKKTKPNSFSQIQKSEVKPTWQSWLSTPAPKIVTSPEKLLLQNQLIAAQAKSATPVLQNRWLTAPKPESKSVDKGALEQLLRLVAEGEQDKAEELIKEDNNLLLYAGSVRDLSGREFKQITAFQYALWAMDWHMWTMIQKYLPPEMQREQLQTLDSKSTEYGKHFSLQPLIEALQVYVDNAKVWQYGKQARDHWGKVVGGAQRELPVCVINEYCRSDRAFHPCPSFTEEKLPRSRFAEVYKDSLRVQEDWFLAFNDNKLYGDSFAFTRGGGWQRAYGGYSCPLVQEPYDLRALRSLANAGAQRLKSLKSKLLPGASESQMQSVSDRKSPVTHLEQLLHLVAGGEQNKAEEMIKTDKNLLLRSGTVMDLSGREFKEITAFQYSLWAMDWHMWKMIQKYLPEERQREQFMVLESKSTIHGKHFNLLRLIEALQVYVDKVDAEWNDDRQAMANHWCKIIGGAQKMLPAHIVNEYTRHDRGFQPCPKEWESKLPRAQSIELYDTSQSRYIRGSWFTAPSPIDVLGSDFAFGRGVSVVSAIREDRLYSSRRVAAIDLLALQSLWKMRTQQLASLKSELLSALNLSQELWKAEPVTPLSKNRYALTSVKLESKSVDQEALKQLLRLVVEGEEEQAEEMIKKDRNISLLLSAGTVTDLSGREFKGITAFQYALWALDWHMWKMIQKYLPEDQQREQCAILESKGTAYGEHFSLQPLIAALQTYVDKADNEWNYDQRADHHWCKVVGGAQKMLPSHVVNEYVRPDRPFYPCPTEWESKLPRTREIVIRPGPWEYIKGSWFIDALDSGFVLGLNFALLRCGQDRAWKVTRGEDITIARSSRLKPVREDIIALQSLWKTRTRQLESLLLQLGSPSPVVESTIGKMESTTFHP
jgi:serine/threonine protein kinase